MQNFLFDLTRIINTPTEAFAVAIAAGILTGMVTATVGRILSTITGSYNRA